MKRWSAVAVAGMLFANGAWAQEAEEATTTAAAENTEMEAEAPAGKQNVVYIAPLSLIGGFVHWEYERALNPNLSFAVGVPVQLPFGAAGLLGSVLGGSFFGVGGMGAVRYYFTGTAPSGFFVGPEVSLNYTYGSGNIEGVEWSGSGVGFGLTAMVGYSLVTDGGFSFSGGLGLGAGVNGSSAALSAGGQSVNGNDATFGFSPALRLNVGYAF